MGNRRRRLAKVAAIVLLVAVTVRLLPLLWTPYPFNPDGFSFAVQARETVADGILARELIGPHGYTFPTLLSIAAIVTAVTPLWLAQPIIAVVGAVPAVIAVGFVWRLAGNKAETALTVAALAAGVTLAVEGVYLRRTVTVSYEVLGLLFVVLVAIGTHRLLRTRRPVWLLATVPMLVVLPITHHLSTFMAALAITGVVVVAISRSPRRSIGPGIALIAPFWLYLGGYYWLTRPPFSSDLAAKPGLFVAWVVLLVAGAVWLARSPDRHLRLASGAILAGGFALLGANAVWDLFPGTATTPTLLLVYVAPLSVLALLGAWGLPAGIGPNGDRAIVLGLLVGPLAWVGFSLTAGVDPVYALFARRGQTFVHLAIVVCAGLAIYGLARRVDSDRSTTVAVGLGIVLCLCAIASLPLAFSGLEALAYQGTTTSEEFETLTFASATMDEDWTSDDHVTRVASNYYETSVSPQPTYDWLQGGSLACPTVTQHSWQTVGAQQYPSSPLTIEESLLTEQTAHTVYATTGDDPMSIVIPIDGSNC